MNKKDCKIVQDLLPNYIDKLTNEETNEFVKNHLQECKDCKEILENMKKDLNIEEKKKDKKIINFIKKYNKKMRMLKLIILLIILLIIIIYLILFGRKALIVLNLANTSKSVIDAKNYLLDSNIYTYNFVYFMNYDKRDNQYIRNIECAHLYEGEDTKISEYCNGETSNYYTEIGKEQRTAILSYEKGSIFPLELKDICSAKIIENRNLIKNLCRMSIVSRKQDYYISNIWLDNFGNCDIYVSKSTGVITKIILHEGYIGSMIVGDATIDINYRIHENDDESSTEWFKEPNIVEYEILEQ